MYNSENKQNYNTAIGKLKKHTQTKHSASFLSNCVQHDLIPNTFKIPNPLQEVSIEHTNEVNKILRNTSTLLVSTTLKFLKNKVKRTLEMKNKAVTKLLDNIVSIKEKIEVEAKLKNVQDNYEKKLIEKYESKQNWLKQKSNQKTNPNKPTQAKESDSETQLLTTTMMKTQSPPIEKVTISS